MKIALVHELLTMPGGAERVLGMLAAMFPDAPIYTLLYDESVMGGRFPRERVRTSRIQSIAACLPLGRRRFNHHLYLSRFPRAVEAWDFSEFDLVISSSSAFVHGIKTTGRTRHLCYVHAPARYLWDRTFDVQASAGGALKRAYLRPLFHRLRTWDATVASRPDTLLAASKNVQRRIELYWRRESQVVYPGIDDVWFTAVPNPNPQPYFLIVSTLAPYKRIDLAIEACNRLALPLKIAGAGRDERRLRGLAGATVEFLGHCDSNALRTLYANASATIFPGDEDFGLVPVEAMAGGTPVIALQSGGALETVIDGRTGVFFNAPTADALTETLRTFSRTNFSDDACRAQARRFTRETFEAGIRAAIAALPSA